MGESKPFMDRRGFFKKLLGGSTIERSFFAVQVVFDAAGQEALRAQLQGVLDEVGEESVEDKRRFYKRLTSLMVEAEPFFEYGFVEYLTRSGETQDTFDQWVAEIESSFASEEEEIGEEIDGYHRISSSQRYIVISLIFLIEGTHPLHGQELDHEEIYTRAGMGKMIDSVNRLNFNKVLADAAYLVPGSPDDGFSWADFADEGWTYLVSLPF